MVVMSLMLMFVLSIVRVVMFSIVIMVFMSVVLVFSLMLVSICVIMVRVFITFFMLMFFLLHYSITRRCGRLFVFVREPVALVSGKDQLIQYRSARRQYAYYLKGGVFVS